MVDDTPAWSRAARDALAIAHEHGQRQSESSRRQALISFDHAVEALWAGFLRAGPGESLMDDAACVARQIGSNFWKKANWFVGYVSTHSIKFSWTPDQLNEVRSERNALQHGGEWRVPAASLIEFARQMTVGCFDALTDERWDDRYPALAVTASLPELQSTVAPKPGGPALAATAFEVAQDLDAEREGLHYRFLAREMISRGHLLGADPGRRLYDALNHAHLTFEHEPGGVYRWKPVDARDPRQGITGKVLGEACLAAAKLLDPDREGIHYRFQILPQLLLWGIAVRGVNIGAATNAAMRQEPHFELVAGRPGVYRWRD